VPDKQKNDILLLAAFDATRFTRRIPGIAGGFGLGFGQHSTVGFLASRNFSSDKGFFFGDFARGFLSGFAHCLFGCKLGLQGCAFGFALSAGRSQLHAFGLAGSKVGIVCAEFSAELFHLSAFGFRSSGLPLGVTLGFKAQSVSPDR